jgi:predicted adenylyl cyclase CyaB
MKEIEAKFLNINRKELEKKLRKLGAKKIFDSLIEIKQFDYPNKALRKNNSFIRLRKINGKKELTFKRILFAKGAKTARELNIEVSSFSETIEILKVLGLKEFLVGKKRRIRYKIKGTQFEFDKYLGKHKYIPEFLEIEGTPAAIKKYQVLLGVKDPKPYSFYDLVKIYKK